MKKTFAISLMSLCLIYTSAVANENNIKCGILDYKESYESSSAFTRFQIRWDSGSRASIARRAEFCSVRDKELNYLMTNDRKSDVIFGILVSFVLLIFIGFFLKKNIKNRG